MIRNPILRGFNPDPSICRVENDYYIATSTFEWYPGVQIHHSRDLVSWRLVTRPLTRATQLDLRGAPDSCGVWAPCLSHADGQFWLIYTDVKRYDGDFKDAHNYLVTAPAIAGPWSDPVYLNSSGFDPSLFHDDDGRKWLVNQQWRHLQGGPAPHPAFDGILLQEYDPATRRLTGPVVNIFAGSPLGLVEGPHIFRREGWYYLTTAEGGTGYGHAVTMARARALAGPYELHPDIHLLTARDDPGAALARAGHGQMVETPRGETYHTHLCSRPLPGTRQSPLGRETALQKCVWRDGWLYLAQGGLVPALEVSAPAGAPEPEAEHAVEYRFDGPALPADFQWLRTPRPERLFTLTGAALRLHGRESVGSWFEQSLVARRAEHHAYRAETRLVAFAPDGYQQAAGLATYYNRHKFHFLAISHDAALGRVLGILSCPGDWPNGRLSFPLDTPIPLPDGPIELAVDVTGATLRFYWRGAGEWRPAGPPLDAGVLSDEGGRGEHGSFTGTFVGMLAFDISGRACPADFTGFAYRPL